MRGAWTVSVSLVVLGALLAPHPLLPDAAAGDAHLPSPPAAPFFSSTFDGPEVLISRVYASPARDDEFVEIVNVGLGEADLGGWSLSDGEAAATFPPGTRLPPRQRFVATRNATSYAEDALDAADFTYGGGGGARMEGGVLRLADDGDEVLLTEATGAVVDVYAYGRSTYAGPGWTGPPSRSRGRGEIAARTFADGIAVDRDRAEDWDGMRDYRIGQSSFAFPELASAASARAFVSPEDGRDGLLSFLSSAQETLEVSVYTLTSEAIASVLAGAARRGVRVRILIDGAPAGGMDEDGARIATGLASEGVSFRLLRGSDDAVKRYRYLHAKYAIADAARVLVSSENFGDSGFPATGEGGNRGWTVAIEEPLLARQLLDVFDEDFDPRRRDSIEAAPSASSPLPSAPPVLLWTPRGPGTPRSIQLVVAPDEALGPDGLLGLLASAKERVWIETFYIEEAWRTFSNPFLAAAFDAARRGIEVRILMDGSPWSTESEDGNDEVAARINARAAQDRIDLEARILVPGGPVERVHNKGVVVDGRRAYIGSLNWALASATENREVGLLLDDASVASKLEAAFLADWDGTSTRADGFRIDDPGLVAALYAIVIVAAIASLRFLRRGPKGLKLRPTLKSRARRRAHLRR